MASISNDPKGQKIVQFVSPEGSRKSIRLGKVDLRSAESVARHVESLLSQKICGQPVTRETAVWLSDLKPKLKIKLAKAGLIESELPEVPKKSLLGEFLKAYILSRPDVKPATLEVWQQPCRNLVKFFGEDKPLRSITQGDADDFKSWMLTQTLAPATVAKRLSFTRTFFHTARKHKLIPENPFLEVRMTAPDSSKRQSFVGEEIMGKLLAVADPVWRTILGLARYAGTRTPSETLSLEWRHIDWNNGRITVPSCKTSRYGKGSRDIPLFESLRPFLEEAMELAIPGQTHVVQGNLLKSAQGRNGWKNCNLRTGFKRLIKKAGLECWPRLFHNLRSSCETELLEKFPTHVVARWMGHDVKICVKHYAQMTDDHFTRAIGGGKSGAESGAGAVQKAVQQGVAPGTGLVANSNLSTDLIEDCAESCESGVLGAKAQSGEGGIRTRGTMLLVRRFSKPVLSATQPPLRTFKSTKKYTVTQED